MSPFQQLTTEGSIMPRENIVTQHYTHGKLVEEIRAGIEKLGKSIAEVKVEDLGPVDEFHVGGRVATESFLSQLGITKEHHILDVGCGLGGSSRWAAQEYGCRITGIDLTPEYIATGNTLCEWTGLNTQIQLQVEDATALSHADNSFDAAYMMHVGMNIEDKNALATELHRVVRPGCKVGIYDVMRVEAGDLEFPVPWAADSDGSSVATSAVYRSVLEAAGFNIIAERNRRDFALEFFAQLRARVAEAGSPPPLGLHILMGETAPVKVKNMIGNITRNLIAPIELIAVKAA